MKLEIFLKISFILLQFEAKAVLNILYEVATTHTKAIFDSFHK